MTTIAMARIDSAVGASLSSTPQLVTGGLSPKPRNDRAVSPRIIAGTERVAETVGGVADEAADEAGEAAREAEGEATGEPGAVVDRPVQENPPPAAE